MKYIFTVLLLSTLLLSAKFADKLPAESKLLLDSFECFSKEDKIMSIAYLLALKYRIDNVDTREELVKTELDYWRLWHIESDIENECKLYYKFDDILEETLIQTDEDRKKLKKLRRVEGSIHVDGASESSAKMDKYDAVLRKITLLDPPKYKVLPKNPDMSDYDLTSLKKYPEKSIPKNIFDQIEKMKATALQKEILRREAYLREEMIRNYDKPEKRKVMKQEMLYLEACQKEIQLYANDEFYHNFKRKLASRSIMTQYYGLKNEFLPKEIEAYCEHNITKMKLTTFIPKKELKIKIKKEKLNIKLENLTSFLQKYDSDSKKKKYAKEYLTLMKQELYKNSTSTPSLESLKLLRLKKCLVQANDKEDFALIMARVKDFRIEGIKERFYSNIFNSQRWWHLTIKMKMDAEGESPEMKHFFDCNQTLLTPGKMPIKTKMKETKRKSSFTETQRRDAYWLNNEILKHYAVIFENKPTPLMNNEKAIEMGLISKKSIDKNGNIKISLGDKLLIKGMPNGGISLTYYGIPKGKLCTDFIQSHSLNSTIHFNGKTYDGLDYIMLNDHKVKLDHYVYKYVERLCSQEDNNTISFVKEKTVVKHQYKGNKKLDSVFERVIKIKSIDTNRYDPNSAAYARNKGDFIVSGNKAKLYDANLETIVQTLPSKLQHSYNTALSSDGKYLAVGRYGSTIHIWDMQQSKMIKTIKKNIGGVRMFLSDNKTLVVVDKQIKLLDIESEEIVATIKPNYMPLKQKYNSTRISAIAESPDGKMLYIGGNKNVIERWNIAKNIFGSGRDVSYIDKIEDSTMGEIGALTFNDKERDILIIGSKNLKIKFWDTKKKKVQKTYIADEYMGCENIVLSKDGKYMLAIGSHGAFLWKVGQEEQYDILKGNKPVGAIFLEDSSKFIVISRDIDVWKIQVK